MTCVINYCQGKVAGVLFRLNYSIHQHALALDVIQVLDSRNYFFNLAKANTVPCIFTATHSQTASRLLDSLAYIESITDASS